MAATSVSVSSADCSPACKDSTIISIFSYSLHGFNQGRPVLRELMDNKAPDIILLQEHWLTPANLCYFDSNFPEYIAIGISAMESCIEQGPLRGRPFGGVTTLIKRSLIA